MQTPLGYVTSMDPDNFGLTKTGTKPGVPFINLRRLCQ